MKAPNFLKSFSSVFKKVLNSAISRVLHEEKCMPHICFLRKETATSDSLTDRKKTSERTVE
jgi:hypothetical protein